MGLQDEGEGLRLKADLEAWDASTVSLRFLFGERRLEVTKFGRQGPQLIGPVIGWALLNLAGHDRLILSPESGPDHLRKINGRDVFLSAQQAVYLDYVLTGRSKDHA
jgi:hypothetical protein